MPACLASLDAAAARVDVPVRVIVVLDRCTDGSARIARSWPGVQAVETSAGSVGMARGLGAARALAESPIAPADLWLASTDADTLVPENWLEHHLAFAETGTEVVLGTVDVAGGDEAINRIWRRRYRAAVRSDGTHPHVHGANLGLRGSTYVRAGGWPPVVAHEDRLLVAAARRHGAAVSTTDAARAVTSGRQHGRAPGGVAQDLLWVAGKVDDGTAA